MNIEIGEIFLFYDKVVQILTERDEATKKEIEKEKSNGGK